MQNINEKKGITLMFFKLLPCVLLLMLLGVVFSWSCKSKGEIKVDEKEFNFGNLYSVDTLSVQANKSDVVWQIQADKDWVIMDSQQTNLFGSKEVIFSVIENYDTVVREANIFITGQDLADTIFLKVTQAKGAPLQGINTSGASSTDGVTASKSKRKGGQRVMTDTGTDQSVASEFEQGVTDDGDEKSRPAKSEEDTEVEDETKIEFSADEITLGAAEKLESSPITVKARERWTVSVSDTSVVNVIGKDGKTLTKGNGGYTFKLVTKKANATTTPKVASIEFKLASGTIAKIKFTQKPTETNLTVDKNTINFDGEPEENPIDAKVTATNTQWKITSEVPEWLKANPLEGGVGETIIKIKPSINTSGQIRSTKLILVSTGNVLTKEINVVQDVQTVQLKIVGPTENLGNKAESFTTFTIASNLEWAIERKTPPAIVDQDGNTVEGTTWYDLDVTNGTGGEDNLETVTITATQENTEYDRSDTFYVVVKKVRRPVIVTQKGVKLRDVTISLSVDTLSWVNQISDNLNFSFNVVADDNWVIANPVDFISVINVADKQSITSGSKNASLELKLTKAKESIEFNKDVEIIFASVSNPAVTKTLTIKSPAPTSAPKELKVTGLSQGNFIPYLELGNITKSQAIDAQPQSKSVKVFATREFKIKSMSLQSYKENEKLADDMFEITVNKEKYVLGDVIVPGNHDITFKSKGDNLSKQPISKLTLIYFEMENDTMTFTDNSNNKTDITKFELKQQPLTLPPDKPKVFVSSLSFNGYSSLVLLGNPKSKKEDAKSTSYIKRVKLSTDVPIRISSVENKKQFFDISFGLNPEKTNNEYKLGKTILPKGDYYFTIEAKSNYTDPTGFQTNNSLTLLIEKVDPNAKSKKADEEEFDAENNPNKIIYIDVDNVDFAGLHFRDILIIEQESL